MRKNNKPDFFDRPKTRRMLWTLLWAACGLTLVAQFFASPEPHFGFDNFLGFNALFGFACVVALVLVGRGLGFILKRDTDYYDD
ncbi:MAG: hypothetical protein ABIK45_11190 [Pseudomonadota bacterium]